MANAFAAAKKGMPVLGVGLGYRPQIAEETLERADVIDFLEVVSENYLNCGSLKTFELDRANEFQVIPHGVALSIGSTDEIDYRYLDGIKKLIKKINAPWWSDHLSFSQTEKINLHDLCPLPFSKEAVKHVAQRARVIQDYVGSPFLLENITAYMRVPGGEMSEADFIAEILEEADCGMLLDVNNVYVNSHNHKFDPFEFIDRLPLERVVQIHIAGHRKTESLWIDTHGAKIASPVYDLLAYVLKQTKVHAILLERDQFFPKFSAIIEEIEHIKAVAAREQSALMPANRSAGAFRRVA